MKRYEIMKGIIESLFEHEERRLKARELQLVRENHHLGGSSDGFRHRGKLFTNLDPRLVSRARFTGPSPSLVQAVDLYFEDRNLINYDKIRINQALALVLQNVHSAQDIRDALPECLVDLLPLGKDCSRTRSEAFTLADKPRSYNQYMQLREKIEFYLASKMLY